MRKRSVFNRIKIKEKPVKQVAVEGSRHKWLIFLIIELGNLLVGIDSTIVNLSLPVITKQFGISIQTSHWIIVTYLLTISVTVIALGRIADIRGRRVIYTAGFGTFTLASILCSISVNPSMLVASRILQGLGASALVANANPIIASIFPINERGKAQGLNSTTTAVGYAAGYFLGGYLVSGFGWRSIFLVNIPIGIAATIGAFILLKDLSTRRTENLNFRNFDYPGWIYSSLAIGLIIYGVDRASDTVSIFNHYGLMIIAGVFFLILFIIRERKTAKPLFNYSLLKIKRIGMGLPLTFLFFGGVACSNFLMPFYLQIVQHRTPDKVGTILLSFAIGSGFTAPIAGWAFAKVRLRFLTTGAFLLGCFAFFALARLNSFTTVHFIIFAELLLGVGYAFLASPTTISIIASAPKDYVGATSGLLQVMRNLGLSIGTTITAIILETKLRKYGITKQFLNLPENFEKSYNYLVNYIHVNSVIFYYFSALFLILSIFSFFYLRKLNKIS